ncbi:hypothetical protein IM660_14435 [Ruania alkalisoli]|uniref:Histone acetyltransferase Rv0428c-like SH3 domain-containing protein n=1 Tax=Ruania alkalisoli TaxID=2779775 RepID=A0A7M1STA4_9MICO|nr:hypothetical protein [Ruania alkalisoli]QOR69843.1 hypothetical protein IM660_14435 [Ruania alkalisoli]
MVDRSAEPPHWRTWRAGERVVVRFRIPEGGLTDALGELLRVDDSGVEVETRRGAVTVPAEAIVLAKRVPPPPPRRR